MEEDSKYINSKVTEYEAFLNDVLREDLKKVIAEKDKVTSALNEYIQLETFLNKIVEDPVTFSDGLTTQVDLGCNFYAQAKINKADYIMINIGLGFYAELTINEALVLIKKRTPDLEEKLIKLTEDSSKIKSNIKLVLEGLREIQGIKV